MNNSFLPNGSNTYRRGKVGRVIKFCDLGINRDGEFLLQFN